MDYVVDDDKDGLRLDVFLTGALTDISRSRIQKNIADGHISVNNNNILKKNIVMQSGDIVRINNIPIILRNTLPEPQNIPLDIIYEDDYFAVINKPAGLVVHPGNGNRSGTVVNALIHKFGRQISTGSDTNRPGIVHRLDKDTSGALLTAKTDSAHTALSDLFASRAIQKIYTGFCMGAHPHAHEIIDLPLAGSRRDPTKRTVDCHRGNRAITEYRLKAHHCGISLIEFILHTGRTHQIRVHCSYKGFPIIQDILYNGGQDKVQKIPPMERPFAYNIYKCFSRHALHAKSLSFVHPFTGKDFEITAPYHDDFHCALEIFSEKSKKLVPDQSYGNI